MNDEARLQLLKCDLLIAQSTISYDEYLRQLLSSAEGFIQREGITLDKNRNEDNQLIIMYAAYLFRERSNHGRYNSSGEMPRYLRWALNNRLFSERMATTNA